jgi:hypothetical protein
MSMTPVPARPLDVLARALTLESEGRVREAIEALIEVNRRRPNPKVERELVSMRHRAFESVSREPGFDRWPMPAPDVFGPLTGVPEVAAEDLDVTVLRSAIVNHGCLVVRGLLGGDHVERLVDDIDRALAAASLHQHGQSTPESRQWWRPFKPLPAYSLGGGRQWIWEQGSVWAVDSPRGLFDLITVLEHVGLIEHIAQYLGERPALSVKKCTLRKVPADTGTNWHQDGAFLGDGIRTVNAWIALSPCGVDSPTLDVVPMRMPEIVPTGTDGALFDWSVGEGAVERARGSRAVVRPSFDAGDAMLFDEMLLHRTGVSPGMTQDRYTIESWFFAPSSYPLAQIPIAL